MVWRIAFASFLIVATPASAQTAWERAMQAYARCWTGATDAAPPSLTEAARKSLIGKADRACAMSRARAVEFNGQRRVEDLRAGLVARMPAPNAK